MLDIKLKSSRKRCILWSFGIIFTAAIGMCIFYPYFAAVLKSLSQGTFYAQNSAYTFSGKNELLYQDGNPAADLLTSDSFFFLYAFFICFVILGAGIVLFVVDRDKKWKYGKNVPAVFRLPFEIVLSMYAVLLSFSYYFTKMIYLTTQHAFIIMLPQTKQLGNDIISVIINLFVWCLVFALFFWGALCIWPIFAMKKEFFKKRVLCVQILFMTMRFLRYLIGFFKKPFIHLKNFCSKQYELLLHLDFQDHTNKTILRIVVLNFFIVFLISILGRTGLWASILYSLFLLIFLWKYFHKIQEQYKGILKSTRQLAKGIIDEPINEEVGIFTPVQEELRKIQKGFQKAVEEEVKSERMKTDLITNVSHDLKTPLTAIITYIDLLKKENDTTKQNEYIEILERKSSRLKALIEDLFEISKATSQNIVLNYMQIDISDLLKQVCLEYENEIQKANLELRMKFPETKVYVVLDSQKTYRIFENLIVNITKYAMPYTRVYITLQETETEVRISMKNISQQEITFHSDEITDRFVRGDSSRNTEGSGLGLAIAKSFAELQHGSLQISTDADLFKAEISFSKTNQID